MTFVVYAHTFVFLTPSPDLPILLQLSTFHLYSPSHPQFRNFIAPLHLKFYFPPMMRYN
jgi:hypothetical protein